MGLANVVSKWNGGALSPTQRNLRLRLIFQDAVALLSLLGITIGMSILTYFFFHSFRDRRQVLEDRWYLRGQQALASGHAQEAVLDFRSALTLDSGNRSYEMALANALAAAGKTDEAFAYYSTLRDAQPGDGLLNLQLARLAVKKNRAAQAITFYHAALNGDWRTEGVSRRRTARLELARYLLSLHEPMQAQEQLLTAEGNAMQDPAVTNQIAALLVQADAPGDALMAYQRAQRYAKSNSREMLQALLGASQVATTLGEYKVARVALERYLVRVDQIPGPPQERASVQASLDQLQRLLALDPASNLPPKERARRLLADATIARRRFTHCSTQIQASGLVSPDASAFAWMAPRWQSVSNLRLAPLTVNTSLQETLATLTDQTEILANRLCGAPTGDDALLLQLATVPDKAE
jgi:tetratricopeptide (TPR) repeat protein